MSPENCGRPDPVAIYDGSGNFVRIDARRRASGGIGTDGDQPRGARDSHVNWTRRSPVTRARGPCWCDVGATWIAFPTMARTRLGLDHCLYLRVLLLHLVNPRARHVFPN